MTPVGREAVPGADRVPVDLQRHGWLGRFPAEIEPDYRSWLAAQVYPLAKGIASISIIIWVAIPLGWLAVPAAPSIGTVWIVSMVNFAALVAARLFILDRIRERTVFLTLLGLLLTGGDTIYLMTTDIGARVGPGVAVLAAVFMSLLCPLVRLPFRLTVFAVVAYNGSATVILFRGVGRGEDMAASAGAYIVWLVLTTGLVCGMALVGETQMRAKFVDERVIVRQREVIRRYVPPTVVDRIERGEAASVDAPLRRRITVLSSDVVGFTDLADRIDPETLSQVINEYLGALARIIDIHDGTLNEFAGDGVMAMFGAPTDQPPEDQVTAAVAAAQEIQATLTDLNPAWLKLGIDQPIRTRIGINTGVISVGSFGSKGRATYTGIGLQTNIAARIQAQCEPGGILLSHSSWQLVKEQIPCEPHGELTVKGVHYPIKVFTPAVQKRRSEGSSMPRSAS